MEGASARGQKIVCLVCLHIVHSPICLRVTSLDKSHLLILGARASRSSHSSRSRRAGGTRKAPGARALAELPRHAHKKSICELKKPPSLAGRQQFWPGQLSSRVVVFEQTQSKTTTPAAQSGCESS